MTRAASRRAVLAPVLLAVIVAGSTGAQAAGPDPWLDRVRAFEPGPQSGFGADLLPAVVLGPPEGLGLDQGSLDVVSLGSAGRIVVSFDDNAVVDGDGDDFVIFENPFYGGTLLFEELAFVEASADGREWIEFPFSAATHEGLAGRAPVLASSQNGLDPLADDSGGDRFDLADIGLDYVRFVRITDAGALIDDPGNHSFAGTKGGFDLDAAAAIHSVALGCIRGELRHAGEAVAAAKVVLQAEGQRRLRRWTRSDGSFRFCRLRPGRDYDASAQVDGLGTAGARVYIDAEQLRVTVDLLLE